MFARMAAILGRAPSALPLDVTEAVEAAHIMVREGGDEGPRIFVRMGGGGVVGLFEFDNAEATKRVIKRWPDLNKTQVERAVSFLAARVDRATAAANRGEVKRKNWVNKFSE